ncbi:sugar phosphate isomerase/epimerase family protein [Bacillus coahuilensis]|uniref:sugar phosphate isomerase/epimerase family protein n=1 Tax=Bacillus coahuilensis TaxID=408580 RepID=UPI000185104E|nr:sugar phosphate isomerase/epimerase family protein [Bacillus coahuilensis]
MNVSLCTISFRHQLISIEDLVSFAIENHLNGIELWGAHAKNLYHDGKGIPIALLHQHNLSITMLSDYLSLEASYEHLLKEAKKLVTIAHACETVKIRTFAGNKSSQMTTSEERNEIVQKLKGLCELMDENGFFLLIEIHPNTLADSIPSTIKLIEEVNHPALKINFDVLHVWESGAEPMASFYKLKPFIGHIHLKNISSPEHVSVFDPSNVYASSGSREGMVPLFDGVIDYDAFIEMVNSVGEIECSIEWFGENPKSVIARDSRTIRDIVSRVTV